jgi:predicted lipoprotein
MRRPVVILVVVVLVAVIGWAFPLFHVTPLRASRAAAEQKAFNADEYAADFWRTKLEPKFGQAADARAVVDGLGRDAAATARQHGRTLGLSDAVLYFIRGEGTIVAVEDRGITVALGGPGTPADLLLKTGLLFGNTVRDSSGLLDVSRFADSQDFNAVSASLNRIVETQVLPGFKSAAQPGRRLRFTAALEVAAGAEADRPLVAIPLEGRVP